MKSTSEVESLFNAKAAKWNQKYRPGGPLARRASTFLEQAGTLFSPNDSLLDLGCGTGAIAAMLAARGFRMTACDVAGQMIESGKKIHAHSPIEWHLLPPDWKRFPFGSNSFNGIVASSVFEYLPEADCVLAECHRVLKPGGVLVATVPNPRNLMRKVERLARPGMVLASQMPILNRLSKFRSYAAYLKYSRNRMPLDEWFTFGERAHFAVIDPDKTRASKSALVFLVFRKPTTIAESASEKQWQPA